MHMLVVCVDADEPCVRCCSGGMGVVAVRLLVAAALLPGSPCVACCCWIAPFVYAAVSPACLPTAGVCRHYYTTIRILPRFMSLFSGAALSTMRVAKVCW